MASTAALSQNLDETSIEEAAFATARQAIGRTAFTQYKLAKSSTDEDSFTIDAQFFALPLLHDAHLHSLSLRTLTEARGHVVDGSAPFPATLWLGGAEDTYDGRTFSGTISQFVKLLEERARAYAPKRSGWVIEPTTNTNGWRGNASTVAMHALFLDCDGTGTWDEILHILNELGFCYVAYQSGGWTPTTPKWRVVLPLHAPHDTSTDAGQNAWKTIYNNCRVVFGAVAKLLNVGFDPATETPCSPWFLTEKRDLADPERQVVWRPGHALDLVSLTLALPEVADERPVYDNGSVTIASELDLDEARLNKIIDVLSAATARVPSGRRDLYLALPGVMLDRGVSPEDVMAIIEAVSSNYPRKHPEKHADNLHNARTTIAKWEAKTHYTRIGTLNSAASAVAEALDSVLPDLAAKAIVDAMEQMLALPSAPVAPASADAVYPAVVQTLPKRRGKLSDIGRLVSPLASRMKSSKKPLQRLNGLLLGCLLDGVPLPTTPTTSIAEVNEMVSTVMRALGRGLPAATRWQEALDFASVSLHAMDFTQSVERVAMAERAFYEGQGKRNKTNMKKAAAAADFRSRAENFFSDIEKVKG
jgi:hypothetical protein